MSRIELRSQWERRICEFRASGQTATVWCASHDINLHQFRYWTRKFPARRPSESASPVVRWLSVKMDEPTTPSSPHKAIVVRVGQAHIEVEDGFSASLLKQVVQTLADLC